MWGGGGRTLPPKLKLSPPTAMQLVVRRARTRGAGRYVTAIYILLLFYFKRRIAQSVERKIPNLEVTSSILVSFVIQLEG